MNARMLDMARLPWIARTWDRLADVVEAPATAGLWRLEAALRECSESERAEIVRFLRSVAAAGAAAV